MSAKTEYSPARVRTSAALTYRSEVQPLLQSLREILADIDFEHESDINTVQNSSADAWLKLIVIERLQEHHHRRRAPYVERLERLQKRIEAKTA